MIHNELMQILLSRYTSLDSKIGGFQIFSFHPPKYFIYSELQIMYIKSFHIIGSVYILYLSDSASLPLLIKIVRSTMIHATIPFNMNIWSDTTNTRYWNFNVARNSSDSIYGTKYFYSISYLDPSKSHL